MTTFALTTQTFADIGVTVTDALRTQYNTLFLDAYNDGYYEAGDRVHPIYGETKAIGSDKTYTLSGLTKTLKKILYIANYQDGDDANSYQTGTRYMWYKVGETGIIVPDATASGNVYIEYEYTPAALVCPTPTSATGATEPDTAILPAQHQYILAYKAAAAYWRALRNFDRVDEWETKFFRKLNEIYPQESYAPATVGDYYGGLML
jgi:hypothetical protein